MKLQIVKDPYGRRALRVRTKHGWHPEGLPWLLDPLSFYTPVKR